MGKALSGSPGLNSCPSPSLALPCQRRTQNRVSWRAVNLDGRVDPNCLRRSRLCVLRHKNNISPSASCNFPDLMGEDARPRERRWCCRSLASCLTHGALPPNCSKSYICQPKRHPAPCEGLLASTRAVPCPGAGAGAARGLPRGFPPSLLLLPRVSLLADSRAGVVFTGRSFVTWERCIYPNPPFRRS